MRPFSTTAPMPPAAVVTSGVPRRQRLEDDVRQPVDVAAVVPHGRDADDVGGGEVLADPILRLVAEEPDALRDAARAGTLAQLVAERAVAGDREDRRRARPAARR